MDWGKLGNRAILWASLGLMTLGLGVMTTLIVKSFGPEPGANMVLMGMPCVALPTALAAGLTVGITRVGPEGLSQWEWRVGRYLGWPALLASGLLTAFG